MDVTRNFLVEAFWKIHPRLYRFSGGRIGGQMMGLPVLLLESRGRRTGRLRTNALLYLPRGDDFVVIASVLGEPRHPAWFLNLQAHPDVHVQVGRERIPVRARVAEGEERESLWEQVVLRTPDYDDYRRRTERRIPVVVLERAG